jgi:polyhydroxybutyrate depolymerase
VDDVGFVRAVLEDLGRVHRVDSGRVFATGMSNGAIFSHRLGCELSDRIAAIAPVAGTFPAPLRDSCRPGRPVSVFSIHGTDDPLVPYQGGHVKGRGEGGEVLGAEDTLRLWAGLDHCPTMPMTGALPDAADDGTTTRTTTYAPCDAGSAAVLNTVDGGGHTWPGGRQYAPTLLVGKTSRDFDATEAMWEFFARHPAG